MPADLWLCPAAVGQIVQGKVGHWSMMWKGCRGNLLPRISTEVPAATDKADRKKEKGLLNHWVPEQFLEQNLF